MDLWSRKIELSILFNEIFINIFIHYCQLFDFMQIFHNDYGNI